MDRDQYYALIIQAMGDPDIDTLLTSSPLELISIFISNCSPSDFERLKDMDYDMTMQSITS